MVQFQISHVLKQVQASYPEVPALEARLLLQHVLQVDRVWLIAHQHDALQANIHAEFQALLQRRLQGEPIAYILGYREFYGLKLKVTPDTLIPRSDTETLVEAVLSKNLKSMGSRLRGSDASEILDLGTGSGAIALAIAKHCPYAHVTAVDASPGALSVAQENSCLLGIHNVSFMQSDWFGALQGKKFDVIVSNPPYIEENDPHLQQPDLRFEPITALVAGKDGLVDLRRIVSDAGSHLNPHGWLMLEHGYNQARSVARLLQEAGFVDIAHRYDLAGIERVTVGRWQ